MAASEAPESVKSMRRSGYFSAYRTLAVLIGSFALGGALLALFIIYAGPSQIAASISSIPPLILISLFALNLLGLFLYAFSWYLLIRGTGSPISFISCQAITFASIFLYYLTPSGLLLEAARVLLASKESSLNLGEGAATVVMQRILYIIGFVMASLGATVMLAIGRSVPPSALFRIGLLIAAAAIGVGALIYLSVNIRVLEKIGGGILQKLERAISKVSKASSFSTTGSVSSFIESFNRAFAGMVRRRLTFLASFILILGYWSTNVVIMYIVLLAVGYSISIWAVILTIAVGDLIQMTPIIIPGMLGVLEALLASILTAFGIPVGAAASAVLLARIATFWFDLPLAGLAASYYGSKYALKALMKAAVQ